MSFSESEMYRAQQETFGNLVAHLIPDPEKREQSPPLSIKLTRQQIVEPLRSVADNIQEARIDIASTVAFIMLAVGVLSAGYAVSEGQLSESEIAQKAGERLRKKAPLDIETFYPKGGVVDTKDGSLLNIRRTPSTHEKRVGTLPDGAELNTPILMVRGYIPYKANDWGAYWAAIACNALIDQAKNQEDFPTDETCFVAASEIIPKK